MIHGSALLNNTYLYTHTHVLFVLISWRNNLHIVSCNNPYRVTRANLHILIHNLSPNSISNYINGTCKM